MIEEIKISSIQSTITLLLNGLRSGLSPNAISYSLDLQKKFLLNIDPLAIDKSVQASQLYEKVLPTPLLRFLSKIVPSSYTNNHLYRVHVDQLDRAKLDKFFVQKLTALQDQGFKSLAIQIKTIKLQREFLELQLMSGTRFDLVKAQVIIDIEKIKNTIQDIPKNHHNYRANVINYLNRVETCVHSQHKPIALSDIQIAFLSVCIEMFKIYEKILSPQFLSEYFEAPLVSSRWFDIDMLLHKLLSLPMKHDNQYYLSRDVEKVFFEHLTNKKKGITALPRYDFFNYEKIASRILYIHNLPIRSKTKEEYLKAHVKNNYIGYSGCLIGDDLFPIYMFSIARQAYKKAVALDTQYINKDLTCLEFLVSQPEFMQKLNQLAQMLDWSHYTKVYFDAVDRLDSPQLDRLA
jgi:hypothetical protein